MCLHFLPYLLNICGKFEFLFFQAYSFSKIEKSQYFGRDLSDFDEIWHTDALITTCFILGRVRLGGKGRFWCTACHLVNRTCSTSTFFNYYLTFHGTEWPIMCGRTARSSRKCISGATLRLCIVALSHPRFMKSGYVPSLF